MRLTFVAILLWCSLLNGCALLIDLSLDAGKQVACREGHTKVENDAC